MFFDVKAKLTAKTGKKIVQFKGYKKRYKLLF